MLTFFIRYQHRQCFESFSESSTVINTIYTTRSLANTNYPSYFLIHILYHVVIWNILTTFFRGKHLRLTDNNIIPWCLHFLSGISRDSVLSPSASQVQSSPTAQGPWPMLTILPVSWFTFYSHVVIWNILITFFRGKHLRLTENYNLLREQIYFSRHYKHIYLFHVTWRPPCCCPKTV